MFRGYGVSRAVGSANPEVDYMSKILYGAIIGMLVLTVSSCGGASNGVTCQETMPGMQMCDRTAPSPATAVAPQK